MQELSSVSSIEHIEKSLKLVSKPSDLAVLNAAMDMTDNVRRESHREENLSNSLDFELLVNTTREAELLNHCNIPSILESNSSLDFISDSSASIDAPLVPSGVCQKVSCTLLCGYGAHSNRALLHHKTCRKRQYYVAGSQKKKNTVDSTSLFHELTFFRNHNVNWYISNILLHITKNFST